MAFVDADRVLETSNTPGMASFALLGPATNYNSFASGIGIGNSCYYSAVGAGVYEIGIGTVGAGGTTLSRDTILASSTGGGKVNFPAGTKTIFNDYPAGKAVHVLPSGLLNVNMSALTGTMAQFDAACSDGDLVYQFQSATLGNLTLSGALNMPSQASSLALIAGPIFNDDAASFALRGKTAGYNPWGFELYAGGSQRITTIGTGQVGVGVYPYNSKNGFLQTVGDFSIYPPVTNGPSSILLNDYTTADGATHLAQKTGYVGALSLDTGTGEMSFWTSPTSANAGATSGLNKVALIDKTGVFYIFGAQNQIVLKAGYAGSGVSTILRNDGSNFYFLLSDPTPYPTGAWNALRPFAINCANGSVSIANGLTVNGVFTAGGDFIANGNIASRGAGGTEAILRSNGDISAHRGNNSGVVYLGNVGDHYLYWDGSNYSLAGSGDLFVAGNIMLKMSVDNWRVSNDGYQRFYFANGGRTYIGGVGFSYQYNSADRFTVDTAGNGNFIGALSVASNITGNGLYGNWIQSNGGMAAHGLVQAISTALSAGYQCYNNNVGHDYRMLAKDAGHLAFTNESLGLEYMSMNTAGDIHLSRQTFLDAQTYCTDIIASGWHRNTGITGLYNNTYGRGWTVPDGNGSSYGHMSVFGTGLNGWQGVCISNNNRTHLMCDGGNTIGLYDATVPRWIWQTDYAGNFTAAGNVAAYSDLRLKENVRPIDNLLGRRDALAVSAIMYERDGRTRIGYGAQTLREYGCDEFVMEADDAMKLATGLGTLSVAYGETAAVLAVASKLTDERVAKLEAEVAELKALVATLVGNSTQWK